MRRIDECLFCSSRSCYEHVYSSEDNGKTFDEVACMDHVINMHRYSDIKAPKVLKMFVTSSSKQKRFKRIERRG